MPVWIKIGAHKIPRHPPLKWVTEKTNPSCVTNQIMNFIMFIKPRGQKIYIPRPLTGAREQKQDKKFYDVPTIIIFVYG